MSAAALALALALLVAPSSPRRRLIAAAHVDTGRHRLAIVGGAGVAVMAVAFVVPVTVTIAGVVTGATLVLRRRRRLMQRRRSEETAALQAALDVLVGELRVGAHPVTALRTAADEVDGAVAASLREVAARAGLGADVPAGLRGVARGSTLSAHWERLAVCWQLAETHGLAVATLIRTAARDIVERERFTARVHAAMAGARTTAAVLAGLPLLGVGLGQLIGADPLRFLLSGGGGGWLLVVGVVLACAGLTWSDRITREVST
ncbi:type II secretion system F family protein [Mycobacterium hubeiense]|uniref:type II secretion system F family protein n=1 Tax=Mycobacterium hubeiense TaxID=1867256 RepID=UPI000C7EA791|nr:type II secretion system F family protein [Mycobacterium sp. QGD 101]